MASRASRKRKPDESADSRSSKHRKLDGDNAAVEAPASEQNRYAGQIDQWTTDEKLRAAIRAAQPACVFVDSPDELGSGVRAISTSLSFLRPSVLHVLLSCAVRARRCV
jgi:hypothetical protein